MVVSAHTKSYLWIIVNVESRRDIDRRNARRSSEEFAVFMPPGHRGTFVVYR